jgi:competence protein ComEA
VALAALAASVAYRAARVPMPDTEAAEINAGILATGVNPNTAGVGDLTLLPGIGPVKARAIIAYREAHRAAADPERPVFNDAESLDAVPGIGPRTVERISPYLSFLPPDRAD